MKALEVFPKVRLVGQTQIHPEVIEDYLNELGVSDPHKWLADRRVVLSDAELLIEVMSRLCYRSFEPGLNPNVTSIREDSKKYIENVIRSGHGSVLEHASASFVISNVSRVVTHELVRHRAGAAYSQESMRYVRLDDALPYYLPLSAISELPGDEVSKEIIARHFNEAMQQAAHAYEELVALVNVDGQKSFDTKKHLTSALRRVLPGGVTTTIGCTFNFRALRHIIEMRSSTAAEEEMRIVAIQLHQIARREWPVVFGDMDIAEDGSIIPTLHSKV